MQRLVTQLRSRATSLIDRPDGRTNSTVSALEFVGVCVDGGPNGDTPSSGLKIQRQGVHTAGESPVGSSTTKRAVDAESFRAKSVCSRRPARIRWSRCCGSRSEVISAGGEEFCDAVDVPGKAGSAAVEADVAAVGGDLSGEGW